AGEGTHTGGRLMATSASGSFNVGGDWIKTGGPFNANGGTLPSTKAAGTQSVNSGGATFNSVSQTGAATLRVIGNDLTLTGALTNTAGARDFDANRPAVTVARLTGVSGGPYLAPPGTPTFRRGPTTD